jgi:hypothetical protein
VFILCWNTCVVEQRLPPPPCQTLVGKLLGEKFHRGVWIIWGYEQYYPVGNYDDQYMRWTMLHQERGQVVLEFKSTFHTLCTKMFIKYFERHLVLNYRGDLHRYIQTEMEFLDISLLGDAYQYAVKIKQKFRNQNTWEFGSAYQRLPPPPPCQTLVGKLLGEKFHRGVWIIWGNYEQYYPVGNYDD